MPISVCLLLTDVMVVSDSYAEKLVLELDVEATLLQDDDMLEVEGTEDEVEKEGVANGEGKELEHVIIMESVRKEVVKVMPQR